MRISVVLPTYNRCNILPQTLGHLLDQDFPAQDYEIIVVDDGSNDGTDKLLSTLPDDRRLRFFRQQHAGPACAREMGIRSAEGEYILMFDDDLVCSPGLMSAHLRAHQACGTQRCITVGMIIEDTRDSAISQRNAERFESEKASLRNLDGNLADVRFAPNSCAKRALLLEIGGY